MSIKMKVYRRLTGSAVRKFVGSTENFLSDNMPFVHKKIFLPAKGLIKSALLKFAMTSDKNSGILWTCTPQRELDKNFFVSVIVPNFNHAPYLRQRLETVYNQTYKNFEVILLDDCSTDNSRDILNEFYEKHRDNTRVIFNEKNSGSVFKQWQKGIDEARGNLIWIAESDDYSSENFLEELIPAFIDESVQLAFARSDFIQDGEKIFSTENYLSDVPAFDWSKSFSVTAANFVACGMGIKNIIPNVSSAVFKKPLKIHEEVLKLWQDMKLCGDWLFYLDIMKGGTIYYTPTTTNFYRVHKKSTSLKIQKQPEYYIEHEQIAKFVAQNYFVDEKTHQLHLEQLENHYLGYFGGNDVNELKKYFDLEKILTEKRKPNILMCVFAMTIGGGETFPLILANELSRKNFPITVLDFQMVGDMDGVRQKLKRDLPLIRINETAGLRSIVEQFKIDIAHSHHGSVDEAVSFVVKEEKTLHQVVTLHGMYEATEQSHLESILRGLEKCVDAFVYIAEKNLKPFKDFGWKNYKIFHKIGNGLEIYPVNPIPRSELNIPENSFVCCVVSRAIPEKGWQAAADAVTLANKKSQRRIDLLLIGAGIMYDKLNGKVPEFIHLVGFKNNVRDYLATSDIGLLPSEFVGESFPLLIIDSLFAGRAVVSSNLGEVFKMLETSSGDLAGIIFDLKDGKVPVEKLSEILMTLANDEKKFNEISSRVSEASEKFLIENVSEEYIKVYESVVET